MAAQKKPKKIKNDYKYDYERVTFYFEGKQYSARGKTIAEAHEKAAEKKMSLKSGEIGISSKMIVRNWTKVFLETYRKPAMKNKKTYASEVRFANKVNAEIGHLRIKDVTSIHLKGILNQQEGKSLSDTRKFCNFIKKLFRTAYKSRPPLITFDPAEDLELPKTTKGSHRPLTVREKEVFYKVAEYHKGGLLFKVLLECGLRPQEVIALDGRHILDTQRFAIKSAKESGTNEIKSPKTEAGNREVPIPNDLYQALRAMKKDPFEPLFTQQTNARRHTESSFYCLWNSFKKAMDIEMGAKLYRNKIIFSVIADDLVPYCLRHSFCTNLEKAGVGINIAKYLMGHEDIKVTSSIYTHKSDEVIKEAAELIELYYLKNVAK